MANNADQGDRLDRMLAEARGARPSSDLMARVLADAAAIQSEIAPTQAMSGGTQGAGVDQAGLTGRRRSRSFRPAWVAALGGWGGVSGVTLAGVVGLAIGFAIPDTIDTLSGGQIWTLSGGAGLTPDLTTLAWEDGGDV
ncbi:hypothetical protein N0B44_12815 [Roseibacterium beibuensis]|uniref:Dihydroorotate dehydrogenase n=1 Tax=[Roseibacterium] beibuensis TaxID=1193142 RepID=A0ABP9L6N9_9RHOB|nr:hypothetical protein [Roseibacterium beibuensis]MCS6623796.1 hypothetical protein [Roseibacterium beibuensis]